MEFWRNMAGISFVQRHPVLRPDLFDKTIPIGMHGDGGGFTEHESFIVISWNSLLGTGSTRTKRFLFTAILKKECTRATLDAIFRIFAWCVNSMLTGRMPTHAWDQEPIPGGGDDMAGGWRACLTILEI